MIIDFSLGAIDFIDNIKLIDFILSLNLSKQNRYKQDIKKLTKTTNNKLLLKRLSIKLGMTFLKSLKNDISIITDKNSMYKER